MNTKNACLLAALFAICLSALAGAAENRVVSLATLSDYAPFCFLKSEQKTVEGELILPGDDSDILQGFAWDVIRESFQANGYTILLTVLPWNRAESAVQLGNAINKIPQKANGPDSYYDLGLDLGGVDIYSSKKNAKRKRTSAELLFPVVKTSGREGIFSFSKSPVSGSEFCVYVRNDKKGKITSIDALANKKIGVLRSWSYGDEFDEIKDIKRVDFTDIETGFRALKSKRITALVGYSSAFDYILEKINWQANFRKLLIFGVQSEFVAGGKDSANAKKLLTKFDEGFAIIKANGKYDSLLKKWKISLPVSGDKK